MSPAGRTPYRLFEVVGLELEYPIVGPDLEPRALVERALKLIHGRPTSDAESGAVGFGNELAAHVLEIKTLHPQRSLVQAERQLVRGLRQLADLLDRDLGARLLPTGMHPLMRPSETELWPRAGRRIYRTYDRVFGTTGHGWLNVQATHVNLPFGTEAETVLLHNAIACLVPYLPALAASSPLVEGRLTPFLDNRLRFYRTNQRRLPVVAGDVVPEFVTSFRDYRSRVLKPIYRALDRVPGGDVLQHEWVNSRGAIVRFMRRAIEIRVLDTQECVKADVAVAAFARGALRWMVDELREGRLPLPPHDALVKDFRRVIREGRRAEVAAPHLSLGGGRRTAQRVLQALADRAHDGLAAGERPYLAIVAERLSRGSLAERIRAAVESGTPIPSVYRDLARCLVENRVWTG